jgi:hypothetical protein
MRRAVLVVAAMALALLLASGVAWAVNKVGTDGPDILRGTNRADNLLGEGRKRHAPRSSRQRSPARRAGQGHPRRRQRTPPLR